MDFSKFGKNLSYVASACPAHSTHTTAPSTFAVRVEL